MVVRSVRRNTDVGSGLFFGAPGGNILYKGPVGSSWFQDLVSLSGHPVGVVCTWVRSVRQYTGGDSSSEYPVGTVCTGI